MVGRFPCKPNSPLDTETAALDAEVAAVRHLQLLVYAVNDVRDCVPTDPAAVTELQDVQLNSTTLVHLGHFHHAGT
jgi:hypothetical protein